jgi:CubicO group peptidase (beta-lactamase class C family)
MTERRPSSFCILAFLATTMGAQPQVLYAQTERVSANTPRSTPGGATFTVPAGWTISTRQSLIVLGPPEPDSHIAILEVSNPDPAAAVAAAWKAYQPSMKRPVRTDSHRPGRNGWEEQRGYVYESSPNERADVEAIAWKSGGTWTVLLWDGTEPTFEKRAAQGRLIIDSLRPKGYTRESFAGRKAHPLDAARIAQLKDFVAVSMRELGVPGVGMALVDHGQVVFEGGLGVRELGKPAPVDANTLFMAASNTKGMTTLLLARLADEKKLRWEQPVTELYPPFKLGDANTTRQVLVKHLVCACTGLPRQDLEWIFEFQHATPETSMALLGTMQPTSRFGEVFQYSNLMASAAGYVGAHLYDPSRELGVAYDEAMQKKIFDPLGMKSTTFDMARALKGNHATPHGDDIDGKPAVASMAFNYSVMPHRPAGGVWTSAHDLIRYVQLELGRGQLPDGTRVVSEENLLMRRKPQIETGERQSYGMGLWIDTTWDVTVVHHGGSMAGFKSDLMFLPDSGVGAVLLTNSDTGSRMLRPFMRRLLEILFDGRPEASENVETTAANYKAQLAKERKRLVSPADGAEVAKLAGKYHSSALGDLTVRREQKAIVFDFGEWKSEVASRRNDDGTISFLSIDPALEGFEFVVGTRAGKRILTIRDGQHEYVFGES